MKEYTFKATITKDVTDILTLRVNADSKVEAEVKAKEVLQYFPNAHEVPGVGYCYLEEHSQENVKLLSLDEQEKGKK